MIMPGFTPQGGASAGAAGAAVPTSSAGPTIWGLDPFQLHDRFWASHGVQVVRQGELSSPPAPGDEPVHEHAPFYLLMEAKALAVFDPSAAEEELSRVESELLYVRVHDARQRGGRERVVTDENNRFVRFERVYDRPHSSLARAALTREIRMARAWQSAASPQEGWRLLRRLVPKSHRSTLEREGMLYDGYEPPEVATFIRDLTRSWTRPDCTVLRARQAGPGVWQDRDAAIDPSAKLIGPVWIGAGRRADSGTMVIGPAVLWDDPAMRPELEPVRWEEAPWRDVYPATQLAPFHVPEPALVQSLAQARKIHNFCKRGFDIVFSLVAIGLTMPLYPLVILAIAIEDGWPFFFSHRRETTGGREFPCIKFRSMRKDAEKMKAQIKASNQVDGPQFYIQNDPRLTRVGRIIRKFRIDELPQFFNVLVGHMSVVGPRPSPFNENQFCPGWREIRLSVRPGITGLWQIKRTRKPSTDFQEWIQYDIEYVENARWSLDLLIIWKTCLTVIRGKDEAARDVDAADEGKAGQESV